MNHGLFWKAICVLLLLGGACGDDDQGMDEPAATRGERDGGAASGGEDRNEDEGGPADEDEPGSAGSRGGDTPRGGDGSDTDPDPAMMDAATPASDGGDAGGSEPGDAAVGEDAATPVSDCESLAACCEQLRDRSQAMCERAVEAADDMACVAFARRACFSMRDGGRPMPMPMPCEEVLACCADLGSREQAACEAAAAAPEGRACERAVEMFCR